MTNQKHILIIRLSSIGDVALTVPVINNLIEQNPDVKITVVSKIFHAPLFSHLKNINFIGFDSKKYQSFFGMYQFVKTHLFPIHITHIIDLHDVLRSKLIRFFFVFKKVETIIFDKGRNEKIDAISSKSIQKTSLIHVSERYANAFIYAGFSCNLDDRNIMFNSINKKVKYEIGIAPLSKHFTKNYPLDKIKLLIDELVKKDGVYLKILCAVNEKDSLRFLCEHKNVSFLIDEDDFAKEIEAFKKLDLIISMDSANMHIANIFKIPGIAIWGGTHPNVGFTSYYSNFINIQLDMACRPCSIYGRGDCPIGHFNCMKQIETKMILDAVDKLFA